MRGGVSYSLRVYMHIFYEKDKGLMGNTESRSSAGGQGVRAVQIVKINDDHTYTLDEDALEEILMQDHVKDKPVVVVSVAGAFRKGKSFLLDFFLRYLTSKGANDWLGDDVSPLVGFTWKGGSERITSGILMWSEVFLVEIAGEKVAVILMDTQGSFDSDSTVQDCATIFALSTMISSVQVYNVSQNIQEDDLQHLQVFMEYGRLASEDCEGNFEPFQKLQFLVRDWSYPYEAAYGCEGGQKMLAKRLEVKKTQHPELQRLRDHIKSCFSKISCFLMPYPGTAVATDPHFDGRLKDIESEFKKQLAVFVPSLLAPENLVVKKICGQKVKAKDLVQFFKSYLSILKNENNPTPQSFIEATAEAHYTPVIDNAINKFKEMMEEILKCWSIPGAESLESESSRIANIAMENFLKIAKFGGQVYFNRYNDLLEEALRELSTQYMERNTQRAVERGEIIKIVTTVGGVAISALASIAFAIFKIRFQA